MKLTSITGHLTTSALRALTADATDPEYTGIAVPTAVDLCTVSHLSPQERGDLFHKSAAAHFGDKKPLHSWRLFSPYLDEIRTYLKRAGYSTFLPEHDVICGTVIGRADLIAIGKRRRAVVEFKVTDMPWQADDQTVVQACSYAYMLGNQPGCVSTAIVVCYIDLHRHRLEIYHWANHREACRRLRELKAA